MNDNLRAMRDEFRRIANSIGGSNLPVNTYKRHFAEWAAVLDELCPADDGEPLTEKWLRSAIGLPIAGYGFILRKRLSVFEMKSGWIMCYVRSEEDEEPLVDPVSNPVKTRGDFRRLAAAMGVELKGGGS